MRVLVASVTRLLSSFMRESNSYLMHHTPRNLESDGDSVQGEGFETARFRCVHSSFLVMKYASSAASVGAAKV